MWKWGGDFLRPRAYGFYLDFCTRISVYAGDLPVPHELAMYLPVATIASCGGERGVTFGAQTCHLGGLVPPLWRPGGPWGDPGVAGNTPQDTLGSRLRFLSILGGFRDPC